jgi:hypothetical protein
MTPPTIPNATTLSIQMPKNQPSCLARRNPEYVADLQRNDHAQYLGEIAANVHRIAHR